jgi:hypothetical protein
VTDVERFVRQIVRNLGASDPARLHQPISLADIREHIVPYRTNRRALELESSEDYELVLMRLCAGEGGFARTEPDEARAEFEAELKSSNPDLEVVRRHENAQVSLETKLLAHALDPRPELAFAPPGFVPPLERAEKPQPAGAEEAGGARCTQCKGVLPSGRTVNFCPHCGRTQALTHCPVCDTELEAGWRHCVSCGYAIDDG